MADRDRSYQQQYPQQVQISPASAGQSRYGDSGFSQKGPSTGQILAIITLVPATGILLGLAGITLVGTLIALALATPLFVIFSPVLVPAAIVTAGGVAGILTSQAFGLTGLSALSWVVDYFRQSGAVRGEDGAFDYAKRRVQEAREEVGEKARQIGEAVGEKTKQTGEGIKNKSQETGGARTATPASS